MNKQEMNAIPLIQGYLLNIVITWGRVLNLYVFILISILHLWTFIVDLFMKAVQMQMLPWCLILV